MLQISFSSASIVTCFSRRLRCSSYKSWYSANRPAFFLASVKAVFNWKVQTKFHDTIFGVFFPLRTKKYKFSSSLTRQNSLAYVGKNGYSRLNNHLGAVVKMREKLHFLWKGSINECILKTTPEREPSLSWRPTEWPPESRGRGKIWIEALRCADGMVLCFFYLKKS